MNYIKFSRIFQGIRFMVAFPETPTYRRRKFRILVSQHGTREKDSDIGADEYIQYPLNYDDPFWYDLVVVSPHFPASNVAPNNDPNGFHFQLFNKNGLQWLHDLVHNELPTLFSENEVNIRVETNRFYFFGHSRGGMMVHTYIMKFKGEDIFRATSCGGQLVQRGHSSYNSLSDSQYLQLLDAFLTTPVASILGTAESSVRIESVRSFICREVSKRVSDSDLALISPLPPSSLTNSANLTCDLFTSPVIAQRSPSLHNMAYRFLWNKDANHRGRKNYKVARTFLFLDRRRKPLWEVLLKYPQILLRWFISVPKLDRRALLRSELEEQLDIKEPINDPIPIPR